MRSPVHVIRIASAIALFSMSPALAADYPIVDTNQTAFYDDETVISAPGAGDAFYGQDAHYEGAPSAYQDNGDGTVTDLNTGLMWQQNPDLQNKSTYDEALAAAPGFELAGFDDWRLPSVKELYSLIQFTGSSQTLTPYLDAGFFDFRFGDESQGERLIDGQYWSSTEYVGLTMGGDATVFGVNFADGRIKGYPRYGGPGGNFTAFVRYVRGNPDYGINDFLDNEDGTITDLATGLMWQQVDDGTVRNWEDALAYAENLSLAGHEDWRLPNAKELQSLVDYTRAPDAQNPAQIGPAIDPVFDVTETESYFWTGTTLLEAPLQLPSASHAVYVTFGRALGYMFGQWINVHGAGAQRSDPKSGDPADWPTGSGPQGDDVRIFNYVRCVRDASSATGALEGSSGAVELGLRATPNPSSGGTSLVFRAAETTRARLEIFDVTGRHVATLVDGRVAGGEHVVSWEGPSAGVYFARLEIGGRRVTTKIIRTR